jgi:hypothetical protein
MIARMNSILNRQILSGNASLYSSVLGSMLVTLAILDRKFGVSGSLPVDVGGVLFLGCPFLCYLSISFVLPVVFERPIFMRPKPVLFRIAMAVFICFAAVVSWLVFIPVMW